MKLAKGNKLWVAELRGAAVFLRVGNAGGPGRLTTKDFESDEAAARAFVDGERKKRLVEGFVVVDETATISDPFTLDGARKAKPRPALPQRLAHLGDAIRVHVLGGFLEPEDVEATLDDLAALEPDVPANLRATLESIYDYERDAARARKKPSPCVNDRIDAAFAELDHGDIVALQNAGFTQSDGWEDADAVANARRTRGQAPLGAVFYTSQDLERAVRGEGLFLTFGAYTKGREADVARRIVEVLVRHGVDASWDGDVATRIRIAPFEWFRELSPS